MKKFLYIFALISLCVGMISAMEQPPQDNPITPEALEKLKTFFPELGQRFIFGLTGYNELMLAVIMQDEVRVKALMKSEHGLRQIGERTSQGFTALHFAAAFSSPEIARVVLSFGYQPSPREMYSPLALAATRRDPSVLMAMLEINKAGSDRALIQAILRRNVASVFILLCHGACGTLERELELVIDGQIRKDRMFPTDELNEIRRLLIMFGVYKPGTYPSSKDDLELLTSLERAAYEGDINRVRQLTSFSWRRPWRLVPNTAQLGTALAFARFDHQNYQEISAILRAAGASLSDSDNVVRAALIRNAWDDQQPADENQRERSRMLLESVQSLRHAEQRTFNLRQPRGYEDGILRGATSYLQLLQPQTFENVLRHYHGHEMLAETARRALTGRDLARNESSTWRLIKAILDGNTEEVENWLERYSPDTCDHEGIPLLWHALTSIQPNAVEIVNLLLARGAHLNPEFHIRNRNPELRVSSGFLCDHLTDANDPLLITHRESIQRILRRFPHAGLQLRMILATCNAQERASAIRALIHDIDLMSRGRLDPEMLRPYQAGIDSMIKDMEDRIERKEKVDLEVLRAYRERDPSDEFRRVIQSRGKAQITVAYEFFMRESDRHLTIYLGELRALLAVWPHEGLQRRLDTLEGVASAPAINTDVLNHIPLVSPAPENRKPEKSAAEQMALLIERIRRNSLTDVFDILSPRTLAIRDLVIDDMPAIEYLVLRHNFENLQQAWFMIDALIEHGINFNPVHEGHEFLERLISDTNYRRYFTERPRILWQLVDVLEKRGFKCPKLRLRLTQILGIKPADVIKASGNSAS